MNAKVRAAVAITAVAISGLIGCGASVSHTPVAQRTTTSESVAPSSAQASADATTAALDPEAATAPTIDLATLPEAPWSDAPLRAREVPPTLLGAWERADNREWCAPLAPRSFGVAEGARARTSELEGGWAVEFDRRGMPGIARDGTACERCGRGVFGIAGTGMTPDELAGEVEAGPEPSFRDGSHAEVEVAEEERIAAATITVSGQGCVYQVWSSLGREHVEALVRELRLVEVPAPRRSGALAAR